MRRNAKQWTFHQALLGPTPLELPDGEFRGSRTPVNAAAPNLSSALHHLLHFQFPSEILLFYLFWLLVPWTPQIAVSSPLEMEQDEIPLTSKFLLPPLTSSYTHESVSFLSLVFSLVYTLDCVWRMCLSQAVADRLIHETSTKESQCSKSIRWTRQKTKQRKYIRK